MRGKRFTHGDTLIEILFSVAIFGLVAISTVAAMNRGVSQAQSSLESSVARTEIEAQAEALRYINNAYAAQSKFKGKYAELWKQIGVLATDPDNIPAMLNINSCDEAYHADRNDANSVFSINSKGFIVNSRLLRDFIEGSSINASDVIISSLDGNTPRTDLFTTAPLYPRLIYDNSGLNTSVDNLQEDLSTTMYTNLQKAEGVWIVAAYDQKPDTTFYDFYIRSCWFAPGDARASTITTTVRLYNPDVEVNSQTRNDFTLNYHKTAVASNSNIFNSQTKTVVQGTYTFPITQGDPGTGPTNKEFMGWFHKPEYDGTDAIYNKTKKQIQSTAGALTTATAITVDPGITDLYPIYGDLYAINYDCNGGTNCPTSTDYYAVTPPVYTIPTSPTPTKSDGIFKGWSTTKNGPVVYCPSGYARCGNTSASTAHAFTSTNRTLNLYAVWGGYNYGLHYDLNINPGDEIAGAPDSINAEVTEDEQHDFAINTTNMSRTDPTTCDTYTFLGWSTDKNATIPQYKVGETNKIITVTKNNPKLTLYAVWRQDATGGRCYVYKAVLTWGQNPHDLDSHLEITGPAATGGTSHLYFGNRSEFNTLSDGQYVCKTTAKYCLDLDDVESYGPETTMIMTLDANSTYLFYVHHYSGGGDIATSPAKVVLYSRDKVVGTYNAPSNATTSAAYATFSTGRWEVFKITTDANKKATVTTVNKVVK